MRLILSFLYMCMFLRKYLKRRAEILSIILRTITILGFYLLTSEFKDTYTNFYITIKLYGLSSRNSKQYLK